jgi:hypothetical protein
MNRWKRNPARRWNDGSPRGGHEGESGLLPVAERSPSTLYFRRNSRVGWGIQLGDTVSPSVSPSVSPCAGRDGTDGAPAAYRMWYYMWWCLSGARQPQCLLLPVADMRLHWYGRAGPICGARTGLAIP